MTTSGSARVQRASVRRAVQDERRALAAERERIPGGVPGERREAVGTPERERDLDVVAAVELAQQSLEVARRPGAGLHERRNVDGDPITARQRSSADARALSRAR